MTQSIYTQTPDHYHGSIKSLLKVMWCDIPPSMVTHIWNFCSAFNPSKVHTHSSEHTHTVNTHPEQWAAIYAVAPGSSWGFGALLKGTSSWYWGWESAVKLIQKSYQNKMNKKSYFLFHCLTKTGIPVTLNEQEKKHTELPKWMMGNVVKTGQFTDILHQ